jgi:hypothetical protein
LSASSGNQRGCPRCGASIQGETKFCPSCGYRLDETPKAEQGGAGTARTASQSILQKLVPRRPQPSGQAPSDVPRVRTASEFTQPVASWPTKCPNCGFDLKAGVKYCASCGFNVEVWLKRRTIPGNKGSPSYYTSRKRFFSFEGYSLEGVTPAAAMFLIWGLWNLLTSVFALTGNVKIFYPMISGAPPGFETTGWTVGVLFVVGIALLLSAFGLMQVNSILYLLGVFTMIISIPLSIMQIASALTVGLASGPTGTGQLENLLMGFLGILISFIGLIQSMRIRKYFFGGES